MTEVRARTSISAALRGHDNALGLLRLFFAALVIFDHAFPLGGYGVDPFWNLTRGQASLGTLAVCGFFAISGYLIAKSGMSADVVQFMWRRVLRIFPAYWTLLVVTAFVVGPVLWLAEGNALGQYFERTPGSPYFFLTGNWTLTIGTYGIRDLLAETTPYGREVGTSILNGSIWTLAYEWTCYLIVAGLVLLGVMKGARLVVPALTAFFLFIVVGFTFRPVGMAALFPQFVDPQFQVLTLTFLLGSTIAVFSKQIPFSNLLGIASAVVVLGTLTLGWWSFLGIPAYAYLVLYLGARITGPLARIGKVNDYSYGVYVYGFLIQQVLAYLGVNEWGYLPFVLIALILTLGFGWLSWHGVEKWAMQLKDWGPGRGVVYWRDRMLRRSGRSDSPVAPASELESSPESSPESSAVADLPADAIPHEADLEPDPTRSPAGGR